MAAIQKWGNSQGIRFPKEVLEEAGIAVGDEVEVKARRGEIVVKPKRRVRGKYRLKDLLARMPADYAVAEEDWGKPVGKEAW
ncbi:MAG TPA: AbrB/MazE/SpoVT family DNA-binding domain-containing protein [Planctomycetota bacterium]|nr:AbrB/MazE/SpoVT family DNA-binding domain-containing protein [Planctomycetota bacterium]